jgi:hypothetical protein
MVPRVRLCVVFCTNSHTHHFVFESDASSTSASAASGGAPSASASSAPTTKPRAMSYIDKSHSRPVTDVRWLPPGLEITKRGEVVRSKSKTTTQFVTTSGDGMLMFWYVCSKVVRASGGLCALWMCDVMCFGGGGGAQGYTFEGRVQDRYGG